MKYAYRLFIGLGILCYTLSLFLILQRTNPSNLSFNSYKTPNILATNSEDSLPVQIVISDIGVNLPVYPSRIENNEWNVSTKGVSYLDTSPIPGSKGNSILYGHNWQALLGRLPEVKKGADIEIVYQNGSRKTFTITQTKIVTPDNVSVLKQSQDAKITLYTCTGFLDSHRFVVTATPKHSQYANTVTF